MTTEPIEDPLDPEAEITSVPEKRSDSELERIHKSDEAFMTVVESRNVFLSKALPLAIGITKAHEWNEFGDYVRPDKTAVAKIMRRFGIRKFGTRFDKTESSDEKGSYYFYTCYSNYALPTGFDVVEGIGSCSSRHKFLGTRQGTKSERPQFQVHEDHIMKTAGSNCDVNGIMNLLGLGGLKKEDLKSFGVAGDVATVQFGGEQEKSSESSPRSSSSRATSEPPKEDPAATMPKAKREAILKAFWAAIDKMIALGVDESEALGKYVTFKSGKSATRDEINRFSRNKALWWIRDITKDIIDNEAL
jgi:hypothetical protein